MKIKFFFLFLFVGISGMLSAQSLKLSDFSKCRDGNAFLTEKGFTHLVDSSTVNSQRSFYVNKKTGEELIVSIQKDSEGAEQFSVDYFTKTVADYLQLETAAKNEKYKYNAEKRSYRISESSYSWTAIFFIGIDNYHGAYFFHIRYSEYAGKELSTPGH